MGIRDLASCLRNRHLRFEVTESRQIVQRLCGVRFRHIFRRLPRNYTPWTWASNLPPSTSIFEQWLWGRMRVNKRLVSSSFLFVYLWYLTIWYNFIRAVICKSLQACSKYPPADNTMPFSFTNHRRFFCSSELDNSSGRIMGCQNYHWNFNRGGYIIGLERCPQAKFIWVHFFISFHPWSPLCLERPLEFYTPQKLECLVMRRTSMKIKRKIWTSLPATLRRLPINNVLWYSCSDSD